MGAEWGRSPLGDAAELLRSLKAFHPENAVAVLAWYEDLPVFIEALAEMMKGHGNALTEEFYLDPSAGELARMLGAHFERLHGPANEAAAAFYRAHAEMIRRLREPQRNEAKWDISNNAR